MPNWETKPLADALTGVETVPLNQGGVTKYSTINMIKAFIASAFEATGAVAAGIVAHLAAYAHGDIAHANRAALDLVSGTNSGDQDLSGLATKAELTAATPVAAATAPASPQARTVWYDTTNDSIWQRNTGNTDWVFKGYVNRAYEGVSPLVIETTGNWLFLRAFLLLQPGGVQFSNSVTVSPSGKWIDELNYNEASQPNGLITLSLADLSGVSRGFALLAMPAATVISFPELAFIGGVANINSLPLCTNFNLPKLKIVGTGLYFGVLPSITTLSLPELETIYIGTSITDMATLSNLSVPKLKTTTGGITLGTLPLLTSISFPALELVQSISGTALAALTSLSLPAIVNVLSSAGNSLTFNSGTAALTTVTIGATLKSMSGNVVFSSCALTQASVDHILARLAALDGTNGTTSYNTKTVTLTGTSATPSAAGLASKATLVARGCTVTHN